MVGKEKSKINEGVTARKSPWANQANHLGKLSSRHCRNMWNFQRMYIFQILFQKAGGIPVRRTRMKETFQCDEGIHDRGLAEVQEVC